MAATGGHRISGLSARGDRVLPLDRRHRVRGLAERRRLGALPSASSDRHRVTGLAAARGPDRRHFEDGKRRLRPRVAFRGGHPALHGGKTDWHFRKGRWHKGLPHWRGRPRFHKGRIWRLADTGWFFWWKHAWFWAPVFGVVVTTPVIVEQPAVVTYYPEPGSATGPYAPWTDDWYDWCAERYETFDPLTGYYLGEDGAYHFCVYTAAGSGEAPAPLPSYSQIDPGRD